MREPMPYCVGGRKQRWRRGALSLVVLLCGAACVEDAAADVWRASTTTEADPTSAVSQARSPSDGARDTRLVTEPQAATGPDGGGSAAAEGRSVASPAEALAEAVSALTERSFKVKEAAAAAIAASGDPRAAAVLKALLDGDLYYRKDDRRVVLVERADDGYRLTDAQSGDELGRVGRRDVKKITINNRMRTALRAEIAALTLASPEPSVRLSAALEMVGTDDVQAVTALRAQLEREDDKAVRDAIGLALAIADLGADDPAIRLRAVQGLRGSLYPEARNALERLIASEPDADVSTAAHEALAAIEGRLKANQRLETVFFGLSLGSVLVLAAIGLAITFGVMGVINMAHGELIMIGAYTTYLVQLAMPQAIDYSLIVAIPAAFVVSGLFGIAIERSVIRFLYGRPLETLLATFGISLILQQLVRTAISAQNVIVENPSWMSGSLQINPALALTYNRIYILGFALLIFGALLITLKRTSLGLQVRAVSQNRAMARAMGVRSARVDALTFGLGAGIAGVAGVALSQLTNVGPNMGQAYIIDSFMVVVFGGVGNLWGTLVGGLTLGVANKLLEP
ncbi:MAG: urea ABC transporter permease subunit UrtB, partial [Thiohalocapsa sp.]